MEALQQTNLNERDLQWLQIAHDLKSPLTALEVVAARLKTLPSDERQLLVQAVNRIQEIVVHVLKPAPAMRSVPTPLHEAEAWGPDRVHALILEKQFEFPIVRFQLEMKANGPAKTRIPAGRMNRVLSNLLNNAAEANGLKGEVFIRVQNQGGYQIEIEDQGPGIPADIRPHLGRLGVSGKEGSGCRRGIGLYSAFQFIKEMGGQMTIEDRHGQQGTSVRLNL